MIIYRTDRKGPLFAFFIRFGFPVLPFIPEFKPDTTQKQPEYATKVVGKPGDFVGEAGTCFYPQPGCDDDEY